jgi:hypothetical protein
VDVFAYIDPGTGSLFLQAVIGVLLAGGVIFRNFIRDIPGKLKSLFTRKPVNDNDKAKK